MLLFSQTKEQEYARAKDKTERDEENAPNRRVIVLLFHKGSRVSPTKWPCPRAKEGVAGCRRRFWSDGEQRRSERLPDERRDYSETHDTFACRFYDRQIQVAEGSPCERRVNCIKIRFYDPSKKFIEEAPYEIMINGEKESRKGKANEEGIVSLYFVEVPTKCLAKWGNKTEPDQAPELVFSLEMFLDIEEQGEEQEAPEEAGAEKEADKKKARDEEAREKLNNLGYTNSDLEVNTAAFQRD